MKPSILAELRGAEGIPEVRFDRYGSDYHFGCTNEKGQFAFPGLPNGEYVLIASAKGMVRSQRLLRVHEIVAVGIAGDRVDILPGVARQQFVELLARFQDFPGVDVDIRRLALEAAERLVNHHPRVRQAVALAVLTGRQQHGAHARRLADAHGADVRTDDLHGVVDCESGRDRATRRVDVDMNVLVGIL